MGNMLDAEHVAELAVRVKETYVALLRARGGRHRRYSPTSRHEAHWKNAAALCLQHGFDVMLHVRALLDSEINPLPYMLTGMHAVRRTKDLMQAEIGRAAIEVESQVARLAGCLRVGENIVSVLTNPSSDLSSAFRYAAATRAGLPHIAAKYRDAAQLEMRTHPDLREVLNRLVPRAFAEGLDDGADGSSATTVDDSSRT